MEIIVVTDWIQMNEFGDKEKLLFKDFYDLTKFIRGREYEYPNDINYVGWRYKGNYKRIKVKYLLEYEKQKERCKILQLLNNKMKLPSSLINVVIDVESSDVIFKELVISKEEV